jgi:glycosyltransferase involved in cell wall biosynthesis
MMDALAEKTKIDLRLLIAGDGPQADWLRDQSKRFGPNRLVCLGHIKKDVLANYCANADVFVHPNPKEPFGIGPLEAMASGVPTVAPRSGGVLSYANDDNAWLTEPNGTDFAVAVIDAVTNEKVRLGRIENAFKTARANTNKVSTDQQFLRYYEIYEDFQRRKELFTDINAAKDFDYSTVIND